MTHIIVDAGKQKGEVSPLIYGVLMEDIGRVIYRGIYEPDSPLSNSEGIRQDVLKKVQELKPTIIRWPGGNFASGYNWKNGLGPKEKRPVTFDLAWREVKNNGFGTDEFIEFCRDVSAEPYICVNLGNGLMREAVEWVEYCNFDRPTDWVKKRKEYGHSDSYQVKYWGLGNEMWGSFQIGYKDAVDYAKVARETSKMIKWLDSSVELVLSGLGGGGAPEWNRIIIEKNYGLAKYVSFHRYDGDDTYYGTLSAPKLLEEDIEMVSSIIKSVQYNHKPFGTLFIEPVTDMYIAVDEWNIYYRRNLEGKDRRKGEGYTEEFYNLRDALYAGIVLNTFQRCCNEVKMANLAQLANTIGAIFTTSKESFYQPIFWPLKLYREHCQDITCEVFCAGPVYNPADFKEEGKISKRADYQNVKDVPYLDISATVNEKCDILTLCVVNRHKEESIETNLELKKFLAGQGKIYEINGNKGPMISSLRATGPTVEDTEYDPEVCFVQEKELNRAGEHFSYTFPAHSVTILKLFRKKD